MSSYLLPLLLGRNRHHRQQQLLLQCRPQQQQQQQLQQQLWLRLRLLQLLRQLNNPLPGGLGRPYMAPEKNMPPGPQDREVFLRNIKEARRAEALRAGVSEADCFYGM